MAYQSIQEIINRCKETDRSFYQVVLEDSMAESEMTKEDVISRMEQMRQVMFQTSSDYEENWHSRSGLVGGDGGKMQHYAMEGGSFCGEFMLAVMTEALKMGEANACMQRIVAAPTAGSCGVLPSVYIAAHKVLGCSMEAITKSMFVAAGIGEVIAVRAFIAGATGGCQAEIGAASAMTAGALVSLKGGNPEQTGHAVAMALKNMLGLVCDPVAGLVEIPCVKRNVAGAVGAVSCAEMALAGIESAIPVDQVIDAMREVGENMDSRYKETACGGCAATPMGLEIAARLEKS